MPDNREFKVGDGVHWGFNGDRYPGTVVKVQKNRIEVRRDEPVNIRNPGFYEGDYDCDFSPDPTGSVRRLTNVR